MNDLTYTRAELAAAAGVTRSTVHYQLQRKLKPALTSDGRRVYRHHFLIVDYVARATPNRSRALRANAIERPAITELGNAQRRQQINAAMLEVHTATGGTLPRDFGAIRLGELVDRWGTLSEVRTATKALKTHSEAEICRLRAKEKRGQLVSRKVITDVLLPFVKFVSERLVEVPQTALAERIVARVQLGGSDVSIDVEALIHDSVSAVLKSYIKGQTHNPEVADSNPARASDSRGSRRGFRCRGPSCRRSACCPESTRHRARARSPCRR